MQQLRGRADVEDVDLTSHPSWQITLLSPSVRGLDERDAAMFEGRAA